MKQDDAWLDIIEKEIPELSGVAFMTARKQALDAGMSVLQAEEDTIVRVFPDGRREFVKHIVPPQSCKRGTKINLR